jgi:hypothetical protein
VERTTIAGETEELGENLPQRHFVPPQIPHDQVRFRKSDRSGGKPATNRLSYGAAFAPYGYDSIENMFHLFPKLLNTLLPLGPTAQGGLWPPE